MKVLSVILALSAFSSDAWGTTAFSIQGIKAPRAMSAVILRSSPDASAAPGPTVSGDQVLFPDGTFGTLETIQGGGTVKTYKMPLYADRVQYYLTSGGRPLRCTVELWIGPIRSTHELKVNSMNGIESPIMGTLGFKKLAPVIKITTSEDLELPIKACVSVPSPDRCKEIAAITEKVWSEATIPDQKQLVQGGSTIDDAKSSGSVRTWNIPDNVKSVQILSWSKDVGKKSFKADVEVLQGPNNMRQAFYLRCGGSTQPYHGVIQTPGEGWIIRLKDKKFIEDGLFQFAVVPNEYEEIPSPSDKKWYN